MTEVLRIDDEHAGRFDHQMADIRRGPRYSSPAPTNLLVRVGIFAAEVRWLLRLLRLSSAVLRWVFGRVRVSSRL